jgi:hypothetical protein
MSRVKALFFVLHVSSFNLPHHVGRLVRQSPVEAAPEVLKDFNGKSTATGITSGINTTQQ